MKYLKLVPVLISLALGQGAHGQEILDIHRYVQADDGNWILLSASRTEGEDTEISPNITTYTLSPVEGTPDARTDRSQLTLDLVGEPNQEITGNDGNTYYGNSYRVEGNLKEVKWRITVGETVYRLHRWVEKSVITDCETDRPVDVAAQRESAEITVGTRYIPSEDGNYLVLTPLVKEGKKRLNSLDILSTYTDEPVDEVPIIRLDGGLRLQAERLKTNSRKRFLGEMSYHNQYRTAPGSSFFNTGGLLGARREISVGDDLFRLQRPVANSIITRCSRASGTSSGGGSGGGGGPTDPPSSASCRGQASGSDPADPNRPFTWNGDTGIGSGDRGRTWTITWPSPSMSHAHSDYPNSFFISITNRDFDRRYNAAVTLRMKDGSEFKGHVEASIAQGRRGTRGKRFWEPGRFFCGSEANSVPAAPSGSCIVGASVVEFRRTTLGSIPGSFDFNTGPCGN